MSSSRKDHWGAAPCALRLGLAVHVALCVAWLTASASAQQPKPSDRTIPVSGGTGKMASKKTKSLDLKAGGGATGVFKRKNAAALDPSYDPAQAGKKLSKESPSPDEPNTPPPPPPGRGAANDDVKKIEDLVTFKSNFDKDIKCKRLPLNARVTLDFQEAPIESITKLISCWMNRNFVVASQKKGGKITILSPQPVSVYEAYRAFLSSLAVNGMSVTKKGDFYHIVDTADARSSGADVLGPKTGVPSDDNVVTRLVRMKNIDVKDVEPLVGKFKSKGGDAFVYTPNNTIIITDTGNNIRRIIKLLADVDLPLGTERIWIRPVQNMDPTSLVEKITSVFGDGAKGGAAPGAGAGGAGTGANSSAKVTLSKAIADDRSGQIILICTRNNYLKVDALIRKLDVAIPGEGQIHIHHLENADAEDVASTLSSLSSGGAAKGGARGGAGGAKPAGGAAKGGGSATLFEGDVKITAHKASNALVIESSLKDYVSLQKVIAELDRRRKQVYVEAVIMEISTSKKRQTQFAASGGKTFDIGGNTVPFLLGLGGLGMGGVNTAQLNAGGLAAGLQGPLMNVSAGNTGSAVPAGVTLSIPAFGFLVQAIQENSDVNILSTPHILTLNNEEAEITVGRKVPYRSASMGGMSGGLGGMMGGIPGMAGASSAMGALGSLGGLGSMLGGMGTSMVQFINVDLTLKITPQINESNFIKLKIDEQLDEVEGMDPNLGPTTSKRKVNNTVVVRDQQPVVIGGLITDRETTGVAKIPILGDLPLLGMLFRKTSKQIEKKNLLLIIVPHIIKDPTDLERMHENKMEQIRDFADELATNHKEYEGKIDYRKKKGFLESLFQSVDKAAEERKLIEKAYFDNADVDLVGPPDRHDLDYDPFKDKGAKIKANDELEDLDGVDVIDLPAADAEAKEPAAKPEAGAKTDKPDVDAGDKTDAVQPPAKPAAKAPTKIAPVKDKAVKPAAKKPAAKPVPGEQP